MSNLPALAPGRVAEALHQGTQRVERTHLQVVPLSPEDQESRMPRHLQRIVDGVWAELGPRAFKPIQDAPTATEAFGWVYEGLIVFSELWSAAVSALAPWCAEKPDRIDRLWDPTLSDAWQTRRARSRIGINACDCWTAAFDARLELARTLAHWPAHIPQRTLSDSESERLKTLVLAADFSLMFGLSLLKHRRARPAEGLAEHLAEWGFRCARDAYALVAAPLYQDAPPESDDQRGV